MKKLIKYRKSSQFAFGGLTLFIVTSVTNGLAIVFAASILLGAVFGKTYCKWMCPMGLVMEQMTKGLSDADSKTHMYNYYKLGCPVSWVQGVTNKFSLIKIKNDSAVCVSCDACDKVCYIASINTDTSVYDPQKKPAAAAFNCSKCLACVAACPTGSLKYTL